MTFGHKLLLRGKVDPPSPGGVHVGFNFRGTGGAVNDGPHDYPVVNSGANLYPTSYSGKTSDVTAGWHTPAGHVQPLTFNTRDDQLDARLAGDVFSSSSPFAFQVAVPAGTYRVWFGSGLSFANAEWFVHDGLNDNGVQVYTANGGGTVTSQRLNMLGGWATPANWVSDYDGGAVVYTDVAIPDRGADTGLDFRAGLYTPSGYNLFWNHFRILQL